MTMSKQDMKKDMDEKGMPMKEKKKGMKFSDVMKGKC